MLLVFARRFSCLFVGLLVWTLWHFRCTSFVLVCQRKRKFLMLPIGRKFAWIVLKRLPSLFSFKIKCFSLLPDTYSWMQCFKGPQKTPYCGPTKAQCIGLFLCKSFVQAATRIFVVPSYGKRPIRSAGATVQDKHTQTALEHWEKLS